jgi:hypothetical protein
MSPLTQFVFSSFQAICLIEIYDFHFLPCCDRLYKASMTHVAFDDLQVNCALMDLIKATKCNMKPEEWSSEPDNASGKKTFHFSKFSLRLMFWSTCLTSRPHQKPRHLYPQDLLPSRCKQMKVLMLP